MVTPAPLLHALYVLVNARRALVDDGGAALDAPGQNQTCALVPHQPGRQTKNATRPDASLTDGVGDQGRIRQEREIQKLHGVPQIAIWPGESIDEGPGRFEPGSLVELRGDRSVLAIPAIINGRSNSKGSSSASYDVTSATNHRPFLNVDLEFIHPYRVYEDGTAAICNVGTTRNAYMAPCTVEAHFAKASGFISYRVTYVDASNNEVQGYLPFSKVQRKLR